MLRKLFLLLPLLLATPLTAQTWDLRLEYPFPKGQSLQGTLVSGALDTYKGDLDTGKGAIFSVYHRIIRIGPILRFDWGGELAQWTADGTVIDEKGLTKNTELKQMGLGLGINAQMWLPLTGICGEIGAIGRLQKYELKADDGAKDDGWMGRMWLRVGIRYRIPIVPVVKPYFAASYQQPINKNKPKQSNEIDKLQDYFSAQGKGQEFDRMWTFGIGVTF